MNAVFIMSSAFPYGEAFSSRARYLSFLLNSLGYHVHIIAPLDKKHKETDYYDGKITVQRVNDPKNTISLSGIGTYKPYMNALLKYSEKNKIDIIISSSMVFVADHIKHFANKKKIPYVIEQCEWYDSSIFKFGKINPYYREHIRRIKSKNCNLDGVIAISRLFYNHYSKQGVKCIRIPTILDKNEITARIDMEIGNVIHLVFAGSLGKGKERLEPIFQALLNVNENNENKKRIVLDIYGPSENQVIDNICNNTNLFEKVRKYITVHGRVPQEKIEEIVRSADYSIFIRPDRRSSNAGFPTKFAESMMVGTPVITNNTGDISLYLKYGINGFMLEDKIEEELIKVFSTIIKMSNDENAEMRKNARKTAEYNFDFRVYKEATIKLIESVSHDFER